MLAPGAHPEASPGVTEWAKIPRRFPSEVASWVGAVRPVAPVATLPGQVVVATTRAARPHRAASPAVVAARPAAET